MYYSNQSIFRKNHRNLFLQVTYIQGHYLYKFSFDYFIVVVIFAHLIMILNFQTHIAHPCSQITKLIFQDADYTKIVSVAHDSHLRVWDLNHFTLAGQQQYDQSYLTSLTSEGNSILVGNGDGELMTIDKRNLEVTRTAKLHSDCVTDILIDETCYVTVGYDGLLNFVDKNTLKVIKSVQVDSPLSQVLKVKQKYLVTDVRAFQIDSSLNAKYIGKINRLLATPNRLYGTNDENGFFCHSKKFNSYVPCESMVAVGQGVLGTSWSTASYFTSHEDERISYKSCKIQSMHEGDSILSLVANNNRVYGGAESGNIYSFTLNKDFYWLD